MTHDLPDFKIPHREKIEWMVETNGWAIETVPAGSFATADGAPFPGYAYTVDFPSRFAMAEVVILGLTPVACRGLFDLIADVAGAGQRIEVGVEVLGLFDGEQRAKFVPVDLGVHGHLFPTATAWHAGRPFDVVQLLWPDRNGFLPDEAGFDQKMRFAQPVLGAAN